MLAKFETNLRIYIRIMMYLFANIYLAGNFSIQHENRISLRRTIAGSILSTIHRITVNFPRHNSRDSCVTEIYAGCTGKISLARLRSDGVAYVYQIGSNRTSH